MAEIDKLRELPSVDEALGRLASLQAEYPRPLIVAEIRRALETIETANQEAKAHGVGEARNRVERAVKRTVPFGFLVQTITIAWYAVHGDPEADLDQRLRESPWYRQKATVSYADMLAALRRELIRHEFWAQAPPITTNPKLTRAQSPPASEAA